MDAFIRPDVKASVPTETEVKELYEKINSDPDKIEWEVITSDQAYPSRRKYYIACTTVLFVLLMFMINLFVSSFDVVDTITHPLTWMMSGAAVFANLTIGRITMFPLFRYHYILSRYGLITESHVHSSKIGNAILRKLLAVAAVGSLAAVFIIGPSALVGFAGLGVTWLVLSGANLDKYMLLQRISTYDDIFFLREHDDSDEPRDLFLLFHRFMKFSETEDNEIEFKEYKFFSTQIYCQQGDKDKIISMINGLYPYGQIPSDKKDIFDELYEYVPPQEIKDLVAQTSPHRDAEQCS
ncbi:hypothetical protein L6J37_14790 [Photobacterium sp. WH77]|uniref:hypothetical protein n=1 Tax=unclassified Photobacterium TaxID=2628852 RepID=UPI001EDACA44|nr:MULTISPECIES: hypothetical protein [unclassified Photobacterium]MCG2838102.1 hypothetical protein [Photobacterium sp. WH77]MCG2845720.1 hypothetical protein [Photobacterium sp. WH80]